MTARSSAPVESLGHRSWLPAQARKYASLNGADAAAAHFLDLATELGAALVQHPAAGTANVPVDVFNELAGLVEAVADRVEDDGWSLCPCGEDHGQGDVDGGVVQVMRHHGALARRLCGPAD